MFRLLITAATRCRSESVPISCLSLAKTVALSQGSHVSACGGSTIWNSLAQLSRGYAKKAVNDLKAGDVVLKDDGQLYRILRYTKNMGQARAASSITLDLIEVGSGTRSSDRMRAEQTLEVATLVSRAFQVLYTEGTTVHLMDPETFEQQQVDQSLFGDSQKWLESPNLNVSLQFHEDQPLAGTVPPKLSVSVLEAPEAMQDKDGRVSSRHVTVEGGITVSAPIHVKKGDVIVVRTEDSVYMEKSAKA